MVTAALAGRRRSDQMTLTPLIGNGHLICPDSDLSPIASGGGIADALDYARSTSRRLDAP
jgi:hypothetical protein